MPIPKLLRQRPARLPTLAAGSTYSKRKCAKVLGKLSRTGSQPEAFSGMPVLPAKRSTAGVAHHTSALTRLRHIVKMCGSCAPLCMASAANGDHYGHQTPRDTADRIRGRKESISMLTICYAPVLVACSVIMGLLGFWVGRAPGNYPLSMITCPGLFTEARHRSLRKSQKRKGLPRSTGRTAPCAGFP